MQKWEYCVVGPLFAKASGLVGFHPHIGYFNDNGLDETSLKGNPDKKQVASVIAKLGNEGWEMSGCGATGVSPNAHFLYFKRPIE